MACSLARNLHILVVEGEAGPQMRCSQVLTYFVLLVLWVVLRPGWSSKAEASLDGSQWLYLGLELVGLSGLVLGFGTFLLGATMTFVDLRIGSMVDLSGAVVRLLGGVFALPYHPARSSLILRTGTA